jgi:arabinose-5-phosphate isomerase
MHKGKEIPKVDINASLREAIIEISQKGLGMTAVVDENNFVHGLFTDGDLRRTLETHDSINALMIKDVMTRNPRSIGPNKLAVEAAQLMQSYKISGRLLVVDEDTKLVGALHFDDLLRAGVV